MRDFTQYNKAVYGIIGNPVKHSLSPLLHNTAFKELGVDAIYELMPLEEHETEEFFKYLKSDDCPVFGLNVTVPYKEAVLKYLDVLSPFAEKVGAVNTIVIDKERKLVGYNTDGPGFISHLLELKFNPTNKNIMILGAGGSARAIITTLCLIPDRPNSIKIYNRTPQRLEELLEDLEGRLDLGIVDVVMSIDDLNVKDADLLINTTSSGLNKDDPSLIEEDFLHPGMLVYDLIYNPKETMLLKMAKKQGAMTSNGLGMLFYQGVLSLQHWANTQIEDNIKIKMRLALENAVKKF